MGKKNTANIFPRQPEGDSGRVFNEIANRLQTMSDEQIMSCMRGQDIIPQLTNNAESCAFPALRTAIMREKIEESGF